MGRKKISAQVTLKEHLDRLDKQTIMLHNISYPEEYIHELAKLIADSVRELKSPDVQKSYLYDLVTTFGLLAKQHGINRIPQVEQLRQYAIFLYHTIGKFKKSYSTKNQPPTYQDFNIRAESINLGLIKPEERSTEVPMLAGTLKDYVLIFEALCKSGIFRTNTSNEAGTNGIHWDTDSKDMIDSFRATRQNIKKEQSDGLSDMLLTFIQYLLTHANSGNKQALEKLIADCKNAQKR